MDNQLYIKDVVTLTYDETKCTGCGMCAIVCPHRVFKLVNNKASIVNRDKCMECGACVINCSENAIFVKKGVGCAAAVINGLLNNTEASCGCGCSSN
ncbi:MAG: 4Fe-4S binding protein [Bacteroidales bacterium]|nr:4Fe-4S binding protein [Bacteroidales bacterium]